MSCECCWDCDEGRIPSNCTCVCKCHEIGGSCTGRQPIPPLAGYDSTTAENWRLIQQQPTPPDGDGR